MTLKPCVSVSVAIPVELRQPRANGESDGCERQTAFESKAAQLRPGCKNISGLLIVADAHFAEGAALGEDSSAELDTAGATTSLRTLQLERFHLQG